MKITLKILKLIQKRYSNSPIKSTQNYFKLVIINPQTLLQLIHKHYSNFIKISQNWSTNVTQIDPQSLIRIAKVIQNSYRNVTQIDPQMLLKIILNQVKLPNKCFSNRPTHINITANGSQSFWKSVKRDPKPLLKLTHKGQSKLLKLSRKWSTIFTQN